MRGFHVSEPMGFGFPYFVEEECGRIFVGLVEGVLDTAWIFAGRSDKVFEDSFKIIDAIGFGGGNGDNDVRGGGHGGGAHLQLRVRSITVGTVYSLAMKEGERN